MTQAQSEMAGKNRVRGTIASLAALKAARQPIVMVTAYDFVSAQVAEAADVDVVLVGDSGAMTVLGYPDTSTVTVDEMLVLARAVRRGLTATLMVCDLPANSYENSDEQALASARRFMQEAQCDAVKIEGAGVITDRVRALVAAGIPVMGHVGLTPQTADGDFRARGRTAQTGAEVARAAKALEQAGCFSLVFEAIPAALTDAIMPTLRIPVIGIGAGAATDGQVLVFHDLLGLSGATHVPRFVRRYAELRAAMTDAMRQFAAEVRTGEYPASEHVYGMPAEERMRLEQILLAERARPVAE